MVCGLGFFTAIMKNQMEKTMEDEIFWQVTWGDVEVVGSAWILQESRQLFSERIVAHGACRQLRRGNLDFPFLGNFHIGLFIVPGLGIVRIYRTGFFA